MEFRFTGIDLYSLNQRDWNAFYHVSHRLNPAMGLCALAIRLLTAASGCLMFFMTVGILVSEDASPWSAMIPAVLCVLNLSVAIGYRRYAAFLTRRRLTQPGETMSVTIDDSGVTDRTGGVTTRYEFSTLYAVCWYRDVYLLFINKKSALILPERYRSGGSSGELRRFLEEKTGKPLRCCGRQGPEASDAAAVPNDAAAVGEEADVEFRVEQTYERRDFAGLVTAVGYRQERNRRGRLLWKALKAVLGIWALFAGVRGLLMLWTDGEEIFGPGAGPAEMLTVVLPCLVITVCGACLLLSLWRTPFGAGASWKNYPEKGERLTYCLTEGGVTCLSAGSRLEVDYSRIQCVLEDRERFYLFVDRQAAHMLRKDGFTRGTPEAFREFIARKTGRPAEPMGRTGCVGAEDRPGKR